VAAVYSATPDDIDIIKTWPGGNGMKVHSRTKAYLMELMKIRNHL
jgi:hypothetical protein